MSAKPTQSNFYKIGEIKTILRSLLISEGSRDITLRKLNNMFKDMEGTDIPFQEFHFENLYKFLRSMDDTLILDYNKDNNLCVYHIDTKKSMHISSLVSRQKKTSKKTKSTKPSYVNRTYTEKYFPNYINILKQVLQDLKNSNKSLKANCGVCKSEILSKVKQSVDGQFADLYTLSSLNNDLSLFSNIIFIKDDYIYFKDEFKKATSNKVLVNSEIKQTVASFHENLREQDSQNNNFNVLQYEPNLETEETNSASNVISDRTKIRLEKLIEKHPEGIWCSDLPNVYKYEYRVDLEYIDMGFNSITEFVATLPEIFQIVEPPNVKRQMVLNAKKNVHDFKSNYQTKPLASVYNFDDYIKNDPEPVPNKLSIGVSQKFIPDGVMSLNETVDQICVTSLTCESYIEVNVSEIFTPSFFWITLRRNNKKIKGLMSALDDFYNKIDLDAYKIPQVILEPGLNIACTYSNLWHRGIVKKIKPNGFIVILFYDYGTIKTYHPNDLYFLNKMFCSLPAQAIACGLYNIKPIGSKEWSNKCINNFIDKVWNISLIAIICTINEENNTMMITLTDTSDDTIDIHINDWIIENNLAEWGKMVDNVPIHTMCMYDETVLIEIREENNMEQSVIKESNSSTNSENNYLTYENPADVLTTINNNGYINCLYAKSSVAKLLQKNIHLTKQTNIMAQAILLNMSLDNIKTLNNASVKNESEEDSFFKSTLNSQIFPSENNNESLDIDSKKNLSFINIFDKDNNYSGANNILNEFISCSQYIKKFIDCEMLNQSSYSCTSNYDVKFMEDNNENNYLLLNLPLNQNINNENQDNAVNEVLSNGKFSFEDGTPCFEIKTNTDLLKRNCEIKHTSSFTSTYENNFKENDNYQNMYNCDDDNEIKNITLSETSSDFSLHSDETVLSNSMYTIVYLSKRCHQKGIHLFNLENQGWICASEFVDAFTNLRDQRILFKLLQVVQCDIKFKHLTRETDVQLFSQLDKSTFKAPREHDKNIVPDFVLILMPLKSILQILVKLEFLEAEMIKFALPLMKHNRADAEKILYERYNNKILFDILNLIIKYKKFKSL